MDFLTPSIEGLKRNLISLKYTKTIQNDDLIMPEWAFVRNAYDRVRREAEGADRKSANFMKCLITLINSCVVQKRAVFVLSRPLIKELIANDMNWTEKERPKLHNTHYRDFLAYLFADHGVFEKAFVNEQTNTMVCRVRNKDLLSFIVVDVTEQEKEAVTFTGSAELHESKNEQGFEQPFEQGFEQGFEHRESVSDSDRGHHAPSEDGSKDRRIEVLISGLVPGVSSPESVTPELLARHDSLRQEVLSESLREFRSYIWSAERKEPLAKTVSKSLSYVGRIGPVEGDLSRFKNLILERFKDSKFVSLRNSYMKTLDSEYSVMTKKFDHAIALYGASSRQVDRYSLSAFTKRET